MEMFLLIIEFSNSSNLFIICFLVVVFTKQH